jgi:hypothetical protein
MTTRGPRGFWLARAACRAGEIRRQSSAFVGRRRKAASPPRLLYSRPGLTTPGEGFGLQNLRLPFTLASAPELLAAARRNPAIRVNGRGHCRHHRFLLCTAARGHPAAASGSGTASVRRGRHPRQAPARPRGTVGSSPLGLLPVMYAPHSWYPEGRAGSNPKRTPVGYYLARSWRAT